MGPMREAVDAALAGRPQADPRDRAAERLAVTYAGLMDEAAPAGKYRKALAVLRRHVTGAALEDDDADEALDLVTLALAEHSVASDLGPKLLTTLAGMGLTTAARGQKHGEVNPDAGKRNPVDRIKEQREKRERERNAG